MSSADHKPQSASEARRRAGELERIFDQAHEAILIFDPETENDELEPEESVFDVQALARNMIELMRPRAEDRVLRLDLEDDLPAALRGDPGRLRQILLHLLDNAVKVTAAGDTIVLAVTTGPDAEEEDGEGVQLRFTVRESEPAPAAAPTAASRGRILVAEDNPVNQMVIVEQLRSLGFDVESVGDGRAAIEAVQGDSRTGRPFDLVLMDCQMPLLDGYEAAGEIRRREQERDAPHLPIVALTANSLRRDRERCLEAGMDDFLSKPFETLSMVRVLERWLSA